MKHYFSLLFGTVFACGALTPVSAEARPNHRHGKDHHGDWSNHHRHHRSHRSLRAAHYEWHHGHRVFIPARWVVVFY